MQFKIKRTGLFFAAVSALSMYGLNHSAIVYFVEQLFGANRCKNYKFKFHKHERDEVEMVMPMKKKRQD